MSYLAHNDPEYLGSKPEPSFTFELTPSDVPEFPIPIKLSADKKHVEAKYPRGSCIDLSNSYISFTEKIQA